METVGIKVKGMTCGNCALTVTRALEQKGASQVAANAATGDVSFSIKDEAQKNKLFDTIDSLGYEVVRNEDQDHAHHDHGGNNALFFICIALTIPLLAHMFLSWPLLHNGWFQLALSTPVFLIGWYEFGKGAWRSLLHRLPNMNVLILLGATAAFGYSLTGLLFFKAQAHDYLFFETAASIITLVMLGNWLEHRTVTSTTSAINALAALQPQTARMIMIDSMGKESVMITEPKFLKAGDLIQVNDGESLPADGNVINGSAKVDEAMLTGESEPVSKNINDQVVSGSMLLQGQLRISVTAAGKQTVLAGIVRMVQEAQATRPPLQKLADKISAVFVPVVLGISLLTFLLSYFIFHLTVAESMMRAVAVLVVSCPCAMGLATPAAIAVGLGRAARKGILIKGGETLELLRSIEQVVFDKTGTLTTGKMSVTAEEYHSITKEEFRSVIVSLEKHSSHPIAQSIADSWKDEKITDLSFETIEEIKGKGIEAKDTQGNHWQLGSAAWLKPDSNLDILLFKNKEFKGGLKLSDPLRADAKATIQKLKALGKRTILLSGDKEQKVKTIAAALDIDEWYAEQSPEQKLVLINRLNAQHPTAMTGDGINDAPSLAAATVGVSLSDASHIAIQSAQVILSGNRLSALPEALTLGRLTAATIKSNLYWAFLYNLVAIPFAAFGYLHPVVGAALMALSDVVLVLNSLRLGVRRI